MKIVNKPPTPWGGTLATLQSYEESIGEQEHAAMEARWLFGRELLRHLVEYKGQPIIPRDLMTLVIEECQSSRAELSARMRFAKLYPTKRECSDAIRTYPSWFRMTHDGLVETKRKKTTPTPRRLLRTLTKQIEDAYAHHQDLTREEVKAIEKLLALLQAILDQIDRNDQVKVS